jgi:SulP family sulfate permease
LWNRTVKPKEPSLLRMFPFLGWPAPTVELLRAEVLAGLTVGLMVIPQGVAYAALAGAPLVTGIYASLLPALVAALFGASARLSVGPTAITCLMVSASLTGLAEPGSTHWIELTVWLALLTGVLQVTFGFMRFGWILSIVSEPVLMAFTQASTVLIVASQLPSLLGMAGGWQALSSLESLHLTALAFGIVTLLVLVAARRWKPTVPMVLLIVLGASGVSVWCDFEMHGGFVVGPLPNGIPSLYLPALPDLLMLKQLFVPTLVIALVSFLETASSAKVDNERLGRRWDRDQDLIGQGLAKIAAGLSGAFPTSTSFSRSAINLYAGARSGWASLVSVGVVLLALPLLTPLLSHVPRSVLSSVVIAAVAGLLKPQEILRLWPISRAETLIALSTFVLTLMFAPQLYWGVLAGVLLALTHFLHQRLHPRIIEVGLHPDGSLRDRHLWNLPPLASRLYALRMDAALDFASATSFESAIEDCLLTRPETKHVCLFAQSINRIDATGVSLFTKMAGSLRVRGIALHISGMKLPVERSLVGAAALQPDALLKIYRTDAETLTALQSL